MSYKGTDVEDKSITQTPPVPRSIPQLRSLMGEVQAAIKAKRAGSLVGLTEELHAARRKLIAEMISAGSIGAPSATIEAYSGIANEALDLYAEAQRMASGLGSGR